MATISRRSLGLALKSAREFSNITLKDLSFISGLSISSLSRSENGERDPSFSEVLVLAECLKIDVQKILKLVEMFEEEGLPQQLASKKDLLMDLRKLTRKSIEASIALQTKND